MRVPFNANQAMAIGFFACIMANTVGATADPVDLRGAGNTPALLRQPEPAGPPVQHNAPPPPDMRSSHGHPVPSGPPAAERG
jgi:hypothetical protein